MARSALAPARAATAVSLDQAKGGAQRRKVETIARTRVSWRNETTNNFMVCRSLQEGLRVGIGLPHAATRPLEGEPCSARAAVTLSTRMSNRRRKKSSMVRERRARARAV